MTADRYPCAVWLAARFLFQPSAGELSVADPSAILAAIGAEIEREIKSMLRGGQSNKVIELCCGAVALRGCVYSPEWTAATALLRSPVATRQYSAAQDFCDQRQHMIERVAKVLTREGKLSAAEARWIADEPPMQLAS
jgi:hypothetical protein